MLLRMLTWAGGRRLRRLLTSCVRHLGRLGLRVVQVVVEVVSRWDHGRQLGAGRGAVSGGNESRLESSSTLALAKV